MLSSDEVERLDGLLTEVWAQGRGPQVAVVTLPSLGGDSIESVSLAIARGWGLGDKGRDDGVLLVLAKADRKLRIEVGTHFEGVLTDVASHRIIDDVMVPRLKAGDVDGAVDAGVAHILSFVAPDPSRPLPPARTSSAPFPAFFVVIFMLVAMALLNVFIRFFTPEGRDVYRGGRRSGGGGWGSGGGWGGGGGGGFSGGGGGFSGGGSSGSW